MASAASAAGRTRFHTINRDTGNRVHRIYVDSETGSAVPPEAQLSAYDTGNGIVTFEAGELAEALPESDKALTVSGFLACDAIDTVYFDKPYFLSPADSAAQEPFAALQAAMRRASVAALARAVLFRRLRPVLLRPHNDALIAHTLHFGYEVRAASGILPPAPQAKPDPEMRDLARHIIETRTVAFDPATLVDRYDEAIAALVRAKLDGRTLPAPKPAPRMKQDWRAALRASAADAAPPRPPKRRRAAA